MRPGLALAALALAALALASCHQKTATSGSNATPAALTPPDKPAANTGAPMSGTPSAAAQEITTPSGLKYQDLVLGDGTVAETNHLVSVHYTGSPTAPSSTARSIAAVPSTSSSAPAR